MKAKASNYEGAQSLVNAKQLFTNHEINVDFVHMEGYTKGAFISAFVEKLYSCYGPIKLTFTYRTNGTATPVQ